MPACEAFTGQAAAGAEEWIKYGAEVTRNGRQRASRTAAQMQCGSWPVQSLDGATGSIRSGHLVTRSVLRQRVRRAPRRAGDRAVSEPGNTRRRSRDARLPPKRTEPRPTPIARIVL